VHPLWIFLTALAVGLGSIFALQARWSRARRSGSPARDIVVRNALGWLAAAAAGLAAYAVIGVLLQGMSNRNSASLSTIIGLGAFTLVAGRATRGPDGRTADFASAAVSGLLQFAALVGFAAAFFSGIYWLFGN
jgi:hypothetical protein